MHFRHRNSVKSNMVDEIEPATPNTPLVNRDILCFSHDWTGDPLSKTHLMRLLARDNRILWVNSIGYRSPSFGSKRDLGRIVQKLRAATEPLREVEKNIYVLSPLAIPAFGSSLLRKFSTMLLRKQVLRAIRKLRFREPMNWVFNPAAGALAGTLGEESIIYYCVDEYTAFKGVDTTSLAVIEKQLLEKADKVFVSAEKLLLTKVSGRTPTILIRHGVDFDHFAKSLLSETVIPPEIAALPKPVIGYFGLIAEDWVDVPLLIHVARSFPNGSLVLLGKSTMDLRALEQEPNIHVLGRKPYSTLPNFSKGFDVAVIPFPISEVTLNANPLKAREYLAAGLPVVSTAIPEVEILGECLIARTPDEFVEKLKEALISPGPEPARSAAMSSESWAARLEQIRAEWSRNSTRNSG